MTPDDLTRRAEELAQALAESDINPTSSIDLVCRLETADGEQLEPQRLRLGVDYREHTFDAGTYEQLGIPPLFARRARASMRQNYRRALAAMVRDTLKGLPTGPIDYDAGGGCIVSARLVDVGLEIDGTALSVPPGAS